MKTETDKTVAVEILRQLGGNRFIAMTGAKHFYATNNGMGFRLSSSMTKNKINYIKITLNAMDTYDIEFINIRGTNIKTISTFEGAYNDMLQNIIKDRTGLYLSL